MEWLNPSCGYGNVYRLEYNDGEIDITRSTSDSNLTIEYKKHNKIKTISSYSDGVIYINILLLITLFICLLNWMIIPSIIIFGVSIILSLYWYIPMKKYYWNIKKIYDIAHPKKQITIKSKKQIKNNNKRSKKLIFVNMKN